MDGVSSRHQALSLTVGFVHSGMAMQMSKADLDDAGDEEGNGGGA